MKMRDLINLTEYASKTFRLDDEKVIVIINPTGPELKNLTRHAPYKELRGYYNAGNFYFWSTDEFYHEMLADELDIQFDPRFAFYVGVNLTTKDVVMMPARHGMVYSIILRLPYIRKWFDQQVENDFSVKKLEALFWISRIMIFQLLMDMVGYWQPKTMFQ